jgi:hypothetical protein
MSGETTDSVGMPEKEGETSGDGVSAGLISDISEHLGAIFRHMLPGVLVVGGATLAYPQLRECVDVSSWQRVLLLTIITITVGNAWFALNRYGIHQAVDYFLYLIRSDGPARGKESGNYLTDLGKFTADSLHTPYTSKRARQHIGFRASTVLLLLTLGELALLFTQFHAEKSPLKDHLCALYSVGLFSLVCGFWQMVITRRIDFLVVQRSLVQPGAPYQNEASTTHAGTPISPQPKP